MFHFLKCLLVVLYGCEMQNIKSAQATTRQPFEVEFLNSHLFKYLRSCNKLRNVWDQNWLWQVYVCNSLHSEELLITKITSLLHKQAINTWVVFTMLPMVHFTRTTTLSRTASKIRPCNCWNVLLSLTVASPG